MHQQGGKPFSFLINFDSVMTRPATVRCGKWRPGVFSTRPLRIESDLAYAFKWHHAG
jgi:hypothetical protein